MHTNVLCGEKEDSLNMYRLNYFKFTSHIYIYYIYIYLKSNSLFIHALIYAYA